MFITGYGYVGSLGIAGSNRRLESCATAALDPLKLSWSAVSSNPFPRFGRLDPLCKYACAAVELTGLAAGSAQREEMGIVLATRLGCLDTDIAFTASLEDPGGPSPKLFSYTLPSTAIGEIAIRYGITGPNCCICSGSDTTCAALWEGIELINGAECESCLCVAADAVSCEAAAAAGGVPAAGAFAIMIERNEMAGSLASVGAAIHGDAPPVDDAGLLEFLGNPRQHDILLAAPKSLGLNRAFVLTKL